MSARAERAAAAAITGAAFALFALYSLVTPLFEASDELWHYPMVWRLATGGELPIQRAGQTDDEAPWRQEGSQPPLYYWAAAALSAPFDASNWREIRRLNPHADMGVPAADGNANVVLHTPAESWPWRGAALAARMARLASILMSTATVLFAYLFACELFRTSAQHDRSRALLRLAVPALVACTPMFAFISGSINNDNAAVLFSTVGLWWSLRLLRTAALNVRSAVIAGLIAGLGALSKSSALGLIGLFGLAALLTYGQAPRTFIRRFAVFVAVMLAVALAISGWWFARNLALYGDLLGWNAFLDVVGRRDQPASLAQLWSEREGFIWAYWGVFGAMNVVMWPWMYDGLNALAMVAGGGLLWRAGRASTRGKAISRDGVRRALLCAFWVLLIFVALLRWTSLTPASQGRLMFPCIAVIAAALAYGWWSLHRLVLIGAGCCMAILAVGAPLAFIAPAYAPPADGWASRLPLSLNAEFGGAVQLVEVATTPDTAQPGESATLHANWLLTQPLPENYSVFVHLVDEHDVIVAQRDMYPGQGNLALAEQPAGRRWGDRYTLRLSPLAPAPKSLRWAVGLYDHKTGQRLALSNGSDRLIFGALTLSPRSAERPMLRYANGLSLMGYTFTPTLLSPGAALAITTIWRAEAQPSTNLNISLQVLDEGANKIAQQDLSPPLAQWSINQPVTLTHLLSVAPGAAPGVYRLLLVWYAPGDFSRLPAYDAQGQFAGDQVTLTRLRVR